MLSAATIITEISLLCMVKVNQFFFHLCSPSVFQLILAVGKHKRWSAWVNENIGLCTQCRCMYCMWKITFALKCNNWYGNFSWLLEIVCLHMSAEHRDFISIRLPHNGNYRHVSETPHPLSFLSSSHFCKCCHSQGWACQACSILCF